MAFGFRINPAQAQTLSTLTRSYGAGKIDGFGNLSQVGPIYFEPRTDEEGLLILVNGDVVAHASDGAMFEEAAA